MADFSDVEDRLSGSTEAGNNYQQLKVILRHGANYKPYVLFCSSGCLTPWLRV
jgi:hypothetical protein